MSEHYILNDHEAVPVTWDEYLAALKTEPPRSDGGGKTWARVDKTEVLGKAEVSTVFLGLNHAWGGGPPLIFETMVFGGRFDQECERYSTWEQAEAGHVAWVARVRREEEGC